MHILHINKKNTGKIWVYNNIFGYCVVAINLPGTLTNCKIIHNLSEGVNVCPSSLMKTPCKRKKNLRNVLKS